MVLAFIYIVFTFILASTGNGRQIGYWGAFFAILFLTPIIGLLVVLCSSHEHSFVCPKCKYELKSINPIPPACCPHCRYGAINPSNA